MKKVLTILLAFSTFTAAQNFVVQKKLIHAAKDKQDVSSISFEVYDSNRDLRYSIVKDISYDLPLPDLKVFQDGSAVLISDFDAKLEFYNSTGNFEHETTLAKNYEYERTILPAVGSDVAAFALCEPKLPHAKIFVFSKNALLLDEFDFEKKNVTGLVLSSDNSVLAISGLSWDGAEQKPLTLFTDLQGRVLVSFQKLFERGCFYENNSKFLGWNKKEISLVDLTEGKVIKSHSVKTGYLKNAFFDDNNIWFVTFGKTVPENNRWLFSGIILSKCDVQNNNVKSKKIKADLVREIGFKKNKVVFLKLDNRLFNCPEILK